MRLGQYSLAFAAIFAFAGCGGSRSAQATTGGPLIEEPAEPALSSSVSGSREARALVGEQGGTLSLTNGARVEIPPGALGRAVEVDLAVAATCRAFGDAESQRPLGPVLSVGPALDTSGREIEISIPQQPIPNGFEESDLAFAIEEADSGARAIDTLGTETRWQFFPVRVENGRFVARVPSLPGNRVQFGVAR
jgi:hypothetical protein